MKVYRCGNCEFFTTDREDLILYPKDIFQRVAPGEVMPEGECPTCGALVHEEISDMGKTRRITKTRVLEDIRRVRAAAHLTCMEVDKLNPGDNHYHAMRMQSILGAGVVHDLKKAQLLIENATRLVRTIKKRA